jgi:putative transposase
MSQWPWAKLERRAVCAERCPYGSGRRSAYALLTPFWTAEGWLYVAAVVDLFSRRVVGWSMNAAMTAQLVTDALVMAIWRRGKPDALLHHSDRGSREP